MAPRPAARSKYGAVRTGVDGIVFASKREAARYQELRLLQKAGEIWDLDVQPRYDLTVKGVRLGAYVGDFRYHERCDRYEAGDRKGTLLVVEDVKAPPTRTPIYRWKKRHMLAEHGVVIREI